jgi:hypothetical protein
MLTEQCASRINRARQPRFPIGIQDRNFELAIEHLKRLDYDGPLGLSCDDTKLLPALRPYYDKTTDKHYILGSTGEPLILANPEELTSVLERGEAEKASKVRSYSELARQRD